MSQTANRAANTALRVTTGNNSINTPHYAAIIAERHAKAEAGKIKAENSAPAQFLPEWRRKQPFQPVLAVSMPAMIGSIGHHQNTDNNQQYYRKKSGKLNKQIIISLKHTKERGQITGKIQNFSQ